MYHVRLLPSLVTVADALRVFITRTVFSMGENEE